MVSLPLRSPLQRRYIHARKLATRRRHRRPSARPTHQIMTASVGEARQPSMRWYSSAEARGIMDSKGVRNRIKTQIAQRFPS
jgi:hypothetical protein